MYTNRIGTDGRPIREVGTGDHYDDPQTSIPIWVKDEKLTQEEQDKKEFEECWRDFTKDWVDLPTGNNICKTIGSWFFFASRRLLREKMGHKSPSSEQAPRKITLDFDETE